MATEVVDVGLTICAYSIDLPRPLLPGADNIGRCVSYLGMNPEEVVGAIQMSLAVHENHRSLEGRNGIDVSQELAVYFEVSASNIEQLASRFPRGFIDC